MEENKKNKQQRIDYISHIEDSELIAFFDWIEWQIKKYPFLKVVHHVENERQCTPTQGNRRKRKGVRAGILDISAPIPRGFYHGLYIEMKKEGGKISSEQNEIITYLKELGYYVAVAYSADEAINIFTRYMKLGKK